MDTVYVPSDQPNIQAGLNAAKNGDTVSVSGGIYKGQHNTTLDFSNKVIHLKGEHLKTVIDCERNVKAVYFRRMFNSAVEGFTVINSIDKN